MTSYSEKGKEVLNRSGLFPDYDAAFWYFLKGAQSGEKDAFFMLAECYFHGLGTDKDLDKADVFHHLAEKAGCKVDHIIYEKIENGGRNLTQEEIDKIVAEFYCAG